jgi:hypothetical protein
MPEFAAEPGYETTLVIERSFWLGRPHSRSISSAWDSDDMAAPVYYRLSWVKTSGTRLSILWVGEQPYDGVNLWRSPEAILTQVEIR